jgi:hypothetical protein
MSRSDLRRSLVHFLQEDRGPELARVLVSFTNGEGQK